MAGVENLRMGQVLTLVRSISRIAFQIQTRPETTGESATVPISDAAVEKNSIWMMGQIQTNSQSKKFAEPRSKRDGRHRPEHPQAGVIESRKRGSCRSLSRTQTKPP